VRAGSALAFERVRARPRPRVANRASTRQRVDRIARAAICRGFAALRDATRRASTSDASRDSRVARTRRRARRAPVPDDARSRRATTNDRGRRAGARSNLNETAARRR
jgi:hypothetical protein